MSVIIKGMEMPENCDMCNCSSCNFCDLTDRYIINPDQIDTACPLVEIPKGARLIDAKELYMDIIHRFDYCDDFLEMLENAPTIFEEEQHERKSSRH